MRIVFVLVLALLGSSTVAQAQQATPPVVRDTVVRDTVPDRVSPRGAFVRSLIIPGWGQYSVGAKKRAGIFFVLQSASYYMLAKTLNKLDAAKDWEGERIGVVEDSLRTLMANDTSWQRQLSVDSVFRRHVDTDSTVVGARSLIESRKEQRQDWIAYTLFTTLASGLDAYIAAHLADFPAVITTRPTPDGRAQLRVTVPLPRRP